MRQGRVCPKSRRQRPGTKTSPDTEWLKVQAGGIRDGTVSSYLPEDPAAATLSYVCLASAFSGPQLMPSGSRAEKGTRSVDYLYRPQRLRRALPTSRSSQLTKKKTDDSKILSLPHIQKSSSSVPRKEKAPSMLRSVPVWVAVFSGSRSHFCILFPGFGLVGTGGSENFQNEFLRRVLGHNTPRPDYHCVSIKGL